MVRITRSVVTKAIFSISVVAAVATAGVMGFAQASHNSPNRAVLAASDGYGSIGDQIRAAVEEFQRALRAASDKFQEDVAACVEGLGGSSAELSAFQASSAAATSDFSAQTANPTAFGNVDKFDKHLNDANTTLESKLNTEDNHLIAALDNNKKLTQSHNNEFRQCMRTARNDLRESINDARRTFKETLRDILS